MLEILLTEMNEMKLILKPGKSKRLMGLKVH